MKMRMLWFVISALTIITACSNSKEDTDKAIQDLIKFNKPGTSISIHVFRNRDTKDSEDRHLNEIVNNINNDFKLKEPIPITFRDVRYDKIFNYEKIFEVKEYPAFILIDNKKVVFKTSDPDDITSYITSYFITESK